MSINIPEASLSKTCFSPTGEKQVLDSEASGILIDIELLASRFDFWLKIENK